MLWIGVIFAMDRGHFAPRLLWIEAILNLMNALVFDLRLFHAHPVAGKVNVEATFGKVNGSLGLAIG
ncbi:hypothetical protein vBCbaSRXM_23 [Citromicrobium phage vB_CbaS-RXM]|nr:hypothetical protein vBCbaSRXM_23 [Citromicrobium phage vB_CbaS-RXM]